ncbi:hypothetical protein, partial [Rhizobium sp. ZW T2_16]|uniref:hypothetical protein n=1 Tax=Rhizobium sp. ZW T2_16 TaxID=3378083 RepID=UPI003854D4AB
MAIIVLVAFENGICPGYIQCGGKVEMSDDLQNRNVQLIAIRHTDQPRSERLIPLARSDRGG